MDTILALSIYSDRHAAAWRGKDCIVNSCSLPLHEGTLALLQLERLVLQLVRLAGADTVAVEWDPAPALWQLIAKVGMETEQAGAAILNKVTKAQAGRTVIGYGGTEETEIRAEASDYGKLANVPSMNDAEIVRPQGRLRFHVVRGRPDHGRERHHCRLRRQRIHVPGLLQPGRSGRRAVPLHVLERGHRQPDCGRYVRAAVKLNGHREAEHGYHQELERLYHEEVAASGGKVGRLALAATCPVTATGAAVEGASGVDGAANVAPGVTDAFANLPNLPSAPEVVDPFTTPSGMAERVSFLRWRLQGLIEDVLPLMARLWAWLLAQPSVLANLAVLATMTLRVEIFLLRRQVRRRRAGRDARRPPSGSPTPTSPSSEPPHEPVRALRLGGARPGCRRDHRREGAGHRSRVLS